jgi:hypothetical protein
MTDITDIPYDDVILFFKNNNRKVPNSKKQAYDLLAKLIQTKDYDYYTDSIIDWIMAYNLIQLKVIIPKYKTSEILALSKADLSKLSKLLKMKTIKINHIINILKYLHKLENGEIQIEKINEDEDEDEDEERNYDEEKEENYYYEDEEDEEEDYFV